LREFELSDRHDDIAVRFITIGSQAKAEEFCGQKRAESLCIGDDDKRTYRAMGLEGYNLLKLLTDPPLRKRRAENKAAGFSQNWGATKLRDSAQLPGAAAVDSEGIIRWVHRGTHPGDLPPIREMLGLARDALAS
jgi:alkyl-hydroperoxide reductase/thiol specific antioxidant family protein